MTTIIEMHPKPTSTPYPKRLGVGAQQISEWGGVGQGLEYLHMCKYYLEMRPKPKHKILLHFIYTVQTQPEGNQIHYF